MPEISRFFGIIIAIYWKEHGVPHFHAKYGDHRASFSIIDLTVLDGTLPPRVTAMVLEWAFLHRTELMEDWNLAMAHKPLKNGFIRDFRVIINYIFGQQQHVINPVLFSLSP